MPAKGSSFSMSAALVIALYALPIPSFSQQFGLNMGESVSQLRARGVILQPKNDFNFSAARLPLGNNMFDDYRLLITPKAGLCKIVAWISDINDSPYGDSTKTQYNSLYSALAAKYGNSKSFDFLRAGSIWNESRDWMMSLYKKERFLSAFWDAEEGSRLQGNLKSVALKATAISSSNSMISVGYEFNNAKACFRELELLKLQNL